MKQSEIPLLEGVTAYAADVPVQKSGNGLIKSGTSLADVSERLAQVRSCMENEKAYLIPDLSLPDLSRRLQITPGLLSQIINVGTGNNFNDFVNEYRVDEFKRQVRDSADAHLSLLGLALNGDFNAKATFNRAFKKWTGTSPEEFVIGWRE